jgi:hypothetical protein
LLGSSEQMTTSPSRPTHRSELLIVESLQLREREVEMPRLLLTAALREEWAEPRIEVALV